MLVNRISKQILSGQIDKQDCLGPRVEDLWFIDGTVGPLVLKGGAGPEFAPENAALKRSSSGG